MFLFSTIFSMVTNFSCTSNLFKNDLKLFPQFLSTLDINMKLFSTSDFQIFPDPPTPGSMMGWRRTRERKRSPLYLSFIIEPGVRGVRNSMKKVSHLCPGPIRPLDINPLYFVNSCANIEFWNFKIDVLDLGFWGPPWPGGPPSRWCVEVTLPRTATRGGHPRHIGEPGARTKCRVPAVVKQE